MAKVLEANREKQVSVEYVPFSLVSHFLYWAGEFATMASTLDEKTLDRLKYCISSIVMCGLSVESFVNEQAEEVIEESERKSFDRCKNKYKNKSNYSNTIWKVFFLLNLKGESNINLDDRLLSDLDALIQIRHRIIHYKPEETARKITRPAPSFGDWFTIDFTAEPLSVELSLIEEALSLEQVRQHYNSVKSLARYWVELNGRDPAVIDEYPQL